MEDLSSSSDLLDFPDFGFPHDFPHFLVLFFNLVFYYQKKHRLNSSKFRHDLPGTPVMHLPRQPGHRDLPLQRRGAPVHAQHVHVGEVAVDPCAAICPGDGREAQAPEGEEQGKAEPWLDGHGSKLQKL